jgi:hypothetical protein
VEELRTRLDQNIYQNKLLTDIGNYSFDRYKSAVDFQPKLPAPPPTSNKKDELKNQLLSGADLDTKIKSVTEQQAHITERISRIDAALQELAAQTKSADDFLAKIIADPKTIQRPTLPELKGRWGRFKDWVKKIGKKHDEFAQNPAEYIKKIEDDYTKSQLKRAELIISLENEREELELRREGCKAAIDVIDRAVNGPPGTGMPETNDAEKTAKAAKKKSVGDLNKTNTTQKNKLDIPGEITRAIDDVGNNHLLINDKIQEAREAEVARDLQRAANP